MRVLAGGDTRKGFYRNARIIFKGDPERLELANNFFSWVEEEESTILDGKTPTARAFISLLINLRWVILQDSAVLTGLHKRNNFMFNDQRDVIDLTFFKDFQNKLLSHINQHESVKDETIENCLPGVLKKMDETNDAIKKFHETIKT